MLCVGLALKELPDHPWPTQFAFELARAFEQAGRIGDAAAALGVVAAQSRNLSAQDKAMLMQQMGDIYFRAKRYREASGAFGGVLKVKDAPTESMARATYQLAICYRARGYNKIAENYMWKVTRSYPDASIWARQARGQLYLWGALRSETQELGVRGR